MRITTENGHTYEISKETALRLLNATDGRQADDVFEGHAPHVPARDRGGVWFIVDRYLR